MKTSENHLPIFSIFGNFDKHETHTSLLKILQTVNYSRTSMAQTPLGHGNIFETGVVRVNEC